MNFTPQEKMDICCCKDAIHHVFYRIYSAMLNSTNKKDTIEYQRLAYSTLCSLKKREYYKLFDLNKIANTAMVDAMNDRSFSFLSCNDIVFNAETISKLDSIVKKVDSNNVA